MGLSNEVIFALVAHGAAKLPEVKSGEDRAEWQDFFQTSNFDTW